MICSVYSLNWVSRPASIELTGQATFIYVQANTSILTVYCFFLSRFLKVPTTVIVYNFSEIIWDKENNQYKNANDVVCSRIQFHSLISSSIFIFCYCYYNTSLEFIHRWQPFDFSSSQTHHLDIRLDILLVSVGVRVLWSSGL